mgnify:CR=1 FL=1
MNCLYCETPTENPKFCNQSCAASYNNIAHPKRLPEHKCPCGTFISARKTYCSDTCKEIYKPRMSDDTKKTQKQIIRDYRQKAKEKYIEYKGGKCEMCGYNKCIAALDFHHTNPSEKEFNISSRIVSWEIAKKELDKCILVCANCHREIEYELTHSLDN